MFTSVVSALPDMVLDDDDDSDVCVAVRVMFQRHRADGGAHQSIGRA